MVLILFAFVSILSTSVFAQSNFVVGGGVLHADGDTGFDLTLSAQNEYLRILNLIHLADVGFIPTTGGDRYYMDSFSNGQSRCRDRETGRFVTTSTCHGLKLVYAAAIDVNYIINRGNYRDIFGGIGGRVGAAKTFYGSFGLVYRRKRPLIIRLNLGENFFNLNFGFSGI